MSRARNLMAVALLGVVLGSLPLSGQAEKLFHKAPPGVDEALRPRIGEFYKLEVAGDFREAEKLVCEDSKDAFYNAYKRRPQSYEISNISYAEGFERANALVTVKVVVPIGPGLTQPMLLPMPSEWVLQGGNWCYEIPQPKGNTAVTPFGPMLARRPAEPGSDEDPSAPRAPAEPTTEAAPAKPAAIFSGVTLAPRGFTFPYGVAGEHEAMLKNGLPGFVTVSITAPTLAGLEVTTDKKNVAPNSSLPIHIRYTPTDSKLTGVARVAVRVEPLGKVLYINLDFGTPPKAR